MDGCTVDVVRDGDLLRAGDGRTVGVEDAVHLPPVQPSKIIAVHLTYSSRVAEFGSSLPVAPTYFHKPTSALNSHRGDVVRPQGCQWLNYEGEIAIVLGKRGADLKASQLKDYVWGVTMLADWGIRAPRETPGGPLNFNFPKNFDTSCSMGPCIAVGEADPTNIDMETLVNGECRQRFNTRDMVFTFGEYLEYLSRDFTLYPGDVISGGTAAGTAADSSELLPDKTSAPERFLKPGDVVEMRSPSIGSLRTLVVGKRK